MEFQHFIRHVNTKEQMADILAKGSFLVLSGMVGLVNMCAPPSDKISICTPSQSQKTPAQSTFLMVCSNVAEKESQLEHRHDFGKFSYKTTETHGFLDVDLFRCRERSRCGDYLSRSCGRRHWRALTKTDSEGKAGSGSAHGPPSQISERDPPQSNGCPPPPANQLWDETTTH